MFCYQCQEAARNVGCTLRGVCGKSPKTADLHDLLVFACLEAALHWNASGGDTRTWADVVTLALFRTITNTNFDDEALLEAARELLRRMGHPASSWDSDHLLTLNRQGVFDDQDPDVRSLRQLALLGLKGLAAYRHHAEVLGFVDGDLDRNFLSALARTKSSRTIPELLDLVLEIGALGVRGMALLDRANNTTFGHPEVSTVRLGVRGRPGILVSGHDLRDLSELLEQTRDTGVDIYTHGEMLPAHYYPRLKNYPHLYGNYGGSWWEQERDFERFRGPILLTTNCLVPPKKAYKERVYTTGAAGFAGCPHIPDRRNGEPKDFSRLIEHASSCPPPEPIETGSLTGGFAHATLKDAAPRILEAVRAGKIRKFVVMAGCDGRMASRSYYTEFARNLPEDTIILTAGCAKYRYNKLPLGTIGDFPRVLDAGQCNDSYSLVLIALELQQALGLTNINQLPIVYNIAWYEQKAVIVLLALLSLGIENIHLGPTLPAFLSPAVRNRLVNGFKLGTIDTVEADLRNWVN